tara:strand:- start:2 stop:202 length:201 start_codon:yes stop_codon:yes gene_type:complete
MKQLYRIEEFGTMGWGLIAEDATQLTKEQCDERLEMYCSQGVNPTRMRAVKDGVFLQEDNSYTVND